MKKFLAILIFFYFFSCSIIFPNQAIAQSAQNDPDLNLKVRGWAGPFSGKKELIKEFHPINSDALDPKAPQLNTLIENNPFPSITNLYQVYDWNWETNTKKNTFCQKPKDVPSSLDFFSLIEFQSKPQTAVLVPISGYDIGGGNTVLILYADSNSITLKYTAEDNVVFGYTIHLQNFNVDQKILDAYLQANNSGRTQLPALSGGCKIGVVNNSGKILVAIRDTGTFMDPRWFYDWWPSANSASQQQCQPNFINPILTEKPNTVEGPSMGFVDWVEKREDKSQEEVPEEETPPEEENQEEENRDAVHAAWSSIFSGSSTPTIHYPKINFPKFSPISSILKYGLRTLLPSKITPVLSGDTKTNVSTTATSYKGDELQELDSESTTKCNGEEAKHQRSLSSSQWGTTALGNVALNGLLLPKKKITYPEYFQGDNKYKLKIEQPEDYDAVCRKSGFGPGDDTPEKNISKAQDIKPELFLSRIWFAVSSFVKDKILHETTKKKVKFVYKESLPAGKIAGQNAPILAKTFLPKKIAEKFEPKDEAKALTVNNGMEASVAFSPPKKGYHPVIYKDLARVRNFDCAFLCGLYSKKWIDKGLSWEGKGKDGKDEKVCPSCKSDDYKSPVTPRTPCKNPDGTPDWSKKPQDCVPNKYCHWNPDYYACDYYETCIDDGKIYGCNPKQPGTLVHGCGAGEGAVCEDCSDLPNALYPDTDLSWCGGQGGPKSCWPNQGEVRCKHLTRLDYKNDIYDDPAYNGCYYANANVKVRKNFIGCDGVCNDSCPAD